MGKKASFEFKYAPVIAAAALTAMMSASAEARQRNLGGGVSAPAINCNGAVSAEGVSSHVEGGRDFERYQGQVPPGLARKRALDNWSLVVANACPQYSDKWWRSRGQSITCEGGTGHEYCTASSVPAKKFWSFLFAN